MMPSTRARLRTCGYGRAALDELSAIVAEAKVDDPLAPVTLVAPNTVAGIIARRHLAAGVGGRSGVAGLAVTTLDRLAEQIAAPLLSPARPATAPIVAAAWRAALAADAGTFAPVADHPATIRALARAHEELRDLQAWRPPDAESSAERSTGPVPTATDGPPSLVTPEERVAASGPLGADLIRLHRRVGDSVRPQFYDRTDLLLAAASAVADDPDLAGEWGTVVLYLPQDLTLAQIRFAQAIAALAPAIVLAGLTGVQRADAAVRRTLDRLGLPDVPEPPAPPTAHRVRHASDSDDEVRGVVRQVMAALGSTPAHRIAVLYSAQVPYARLLHEQLAQAGVTINGPGTVPVAERGIARGLLGLLDLAGGDLPRAETFRVLADAPARDAHGARVPLSRWERVSRLAGVVEGDDWTMRLDHFIGTQQALIDVETAGEDPHPGRIEAARRQIDAATGLREFASGLRARLDEGAALTEWPALARWARGLLHALYGTGGPAAGGQAAGQPAAGEQAAGQPATGGHTADRRAAAGDEQTGPDSFAGLPAPEQYAAAAVEQTLAGLEGLAAVEPVADIATLRETLAMSLESALPRVGHVGDGVFVGPLSAAVGLDVDELVLVGLAEDLYPGRSYPDPLLPDEIREATDGALRRTGDRLHARHRHLMAALMAAPSVTACFPRGDLRRSTTRLPTRWLLPTLRELTGDTDLAVTDWESAAESSPAITGAPSHAAALLHTQHPATEQEWRIRAVSSGNTVQDSTIDAAVTMLSARAGTDLTRFDGNLTGAAGLPEYAAGQRRVSPTALESYAGCPHAYFVRRLLRVEPLEQPEQTISISALDVGNLVHQSMDELVRRSKDALPGFGQPWTDWQRQLLNDIADELAVTYQNAGATGHPQLWRQERRRIMADLQAMLDDDDAWRAGLDAQVVGSELTFGKDGFDPVTIALPGGGRVQMVGSADKVDRTRSGTLLVTDIKTGSARTYRSISAADPVVGGTRLQLPVYAHAARQRIGGDRVQAQYWFVRRDRGERVPLDLTDGVEAVYAQTLQTLVTSIAAGLFPAKAPEVDDFAWVQCPYCNPDGIGHRDVRDRWERQRSDPLLAELVALIDPAAADGANVADGAGSADGAGDQDAGSGS